MSLNPLLFVGKAQRELILCQPPAFLHQLAMQRCCGGTATAEREVCIPSKDDTELREAGHEALAPRLLRGIQRK
jgi:hypothetical protein